MDVKLAIKGNGGRPSLCLGVLFHSSRLWNWVLGILIQDERANLSLGGNIGPLSWPYQEQQTCPRATSWFSICSIRMYMFILLLRSYDYDCDGWTGASYHTSQPAASVSGHLCGLLADLTMCAIAGPDSEARPDSWFGYNLVRWLLGHCLQRWASVRGLSPCRHTNLRCDFLQNMCYGTRHESGSHVTV